MQQFHTLIEELKQSPKSLFELKARLDSMFSPKGQRTLTIIKPDAVEKGLIGEVIKRLEHKGVRPVAMKVAKLNKLQAGLFYNHLSGRIPEPVFRSVVRYMTSSRVVLIVWQGRGVVKKVRQAVGPTDPKETRGKIRGLSTDDMKKELKKGKAVRNIIHASATAREAQLEISFFFLPWEIIS
jgi:nucleoside-diphosphate kinase